MGEILLYTSIFIFGLMIGSFLNVVIIRLHNEESIFGRSHCTKCNKQINWYDNIPLISFLLLKASCRNCKTKISWQYPVVELVTGLLFVPVFYFAFTSGVSEETIFGINKLALLILTHLYFISILIIIFVYDIRWYLILDIITLPAIIIGFGLQILLGEDLMSLFWGFIIGGGFFLLQFIVSQGRWIGGGDIRLGALMGIIVSFPNILVALMIAYLMGGLFGGILLLFGKKKFGDKLPFGTFLTVATMITLLYGDVIRIWYINQFF